MDVIENTIISAVVIQYLSRIAENTSFDDVIRQQHGLTYGIYFYMSNISYKLYTQFSCDVSVGNEIKLMSRLLICWQSVFSKGRYDKLMKTIQLKRVLQNLDLTSHNIWLTYHNFRAKDLDEVKALLAVDIDATNTYVKTEIVMYSSMKKAIENIRTLINDNTFSKVYS